MLELAGLIGIGIFLLIVTTLLTVLYLYIPHSKKELVDESIDSELVVMLMVSMFKAQLVIDWSQTTTWRTTHCMR